MRWIFTWGLNSDSDYRITKGTGWLEVLGCGMVDPNVLENCGIDPKNTRLCFLEWGLKELCFKYGVKIYVCFLKMTRFLKQFDKSV